MHQRLPPSPEIGAWASHSKSTGRWSSSAPCTVWWCLGGARVFWDLGQTASIAPLYGGIWSGMCPFVALELEQCREKKMLRRVLCQEPTCLHLFTILDILGYHDVPCSFAASCDPEKICAKGPMLFATSSRPSILACFCRSVTSFTQKKASASQTKFHQSPSWGDESPMFFWIKIRGNVKLMPKHGDTSSSARKLIWETMGCNGVSYVQTRLKRWELT